MTMKQELVSIIIPTYNRPGMLNRAIKSCLEQTYDNIEVLIIDDNNPDSDGRKETEKFMKKYSSNKKVRYIKREKNGGGCASRNTGIENSKGKYVAFLDDDDYYFKEKIEKQVNFIEKNDLDVAFSGCETYDETKDKIVKIQKHNKFEQYDSPFKYHLVEMIVSPQTFMYKKEVLEKIGGFDYVPAGHEYYLMYKTLINNYKVGCMHDVLARICIHSGERITTSKNKLKAERQLYELKRKHFNILSFSQRRQIKYIYKYNIWKKYYNSNNKKHLIYLFYILVTHPILLLKRKIMS